MPCPRARDLGVENHPWQPARIRAAREARGDAEPWARKRRSVCWMEEVVARRQASIRAARPPDILSIRIPSFASYRPGWPSDAADPCTSMMQTHQIH